METFSILLILIIILFSAYPLITNKRATISLVLANISIFFLMLFLYFYFRSSFYPVLSDLIFFPGDLGSYRIYTSITSAFLHIAPMHILMNLIFLFLLGFPLEIKAGSRKVIAVYLVSAIGASALYAATGNTAALGASGAISGLMGALVALYPRDEIPMFLGPIFLMRTPVYLAALVFLVTESAYAFISTGDNIAHTAHIGGLIAGMLVGAGASKLVIKKKKKDYSPLKELAKTPELQKILEKIKGEENEEIAQAWLEEFVDAAKCPKCGGKLRIDGNSIVCECGYRLRL